MKSVRSRLAKGSRKAPTGIAGFDEITGGGLPHGRTTLLVGESERVTVLRERQPHT